MPDFGALGDAKQLDAIAELLRHREIERRDRRDAFDIDRVRVNLGAEGEARQDGELVRGIEAFDVEGRVGFGIAETLRILEALGKGQPFEFHPGEDVVAGAVEDAVEARDRIARQGFAKRLDDRDSARGRSLEGERDALGFGDLASARPCFARSALLAVTTCLPEASAASTAAFATPSEPPISSTTQSTLSDCARATGSSNQGKAGKIEAAILRPFAGGHRRHADRTAGALGECVVLAREDADDGCADRAETGDADTKCLSHAECPA